MRTAGTDALTKVTLAALPTRNDFLKVQQYNNREADMLQNLANCELFTTE